MPRPIGIILAGGRSSRMGQPKHAMRLTDGRALIEVVHEALAPLCERVVISGAIETDALLPDVERIPDDENRDDSTTVTRDRSGDRNFRGGPLGGIVTVMSRGPGEAYLACPCDLPFVTGDLLERLLRSRDRSAVWAASVFQRAGYDRFDPLPARFSARVLPIARELINTSTHPGVKDLLAQLDTRDLDIIQLSEADSARLRNVNTPDEWAAVLRDHA